MAPASASIQAPKSVWDTFAMFLVFDAIPVLRAGSRELTWIPLFGWLAVKQRMIAVWIAVARSRAMKQMRRLMASASACWTAARS